MSERVDERALFYTAVDCLNAAYKELGDAADCLRSLGMPPGFFEQIGIAQEATNAAKEYIGA